MATRHVAPCPPTRRPRSHTLLIMMAQNPTSTPPELELKKDKGKRSTLSTAKGMLKKRHHFLIISMVPPWLVSSAIIVSLAALPSHSLPSGLGPAAMPATAATATAIPSPPALSSEPLVPPFQELSPDIAPLLPSPGGAAPASGGSSSMPTIPSTPSPPNPDDDPLGLDSAVAPESSFMASFAIAAKPVEAVNVVALSVSAALWAMQLLKM